MFKACFKKDMLQQIRTKKFFVYLALSIGMSVFSLLIFAIMQSLMHIQGQEDFIDMLSSLFSLTYSNSLTYFMSFMQSYFLLVVIIMIRNSFSKEINNNNWALPRFSGIKTESLVMSKILANTITLVACYLCGALIHFIVTLCFFSPDVVSIYNLIFSYFAFLLVLILFVVLTLCVDALTKKGALSCLISILILIVGTTILNSVFINEIALMNYTPLAFYNLCITTSFKEINILAITIASVSYVLLIFGLVFLTIKKCKLKPEN